LLRIHLPTILRRSQGTASVYWLWGVANEVGLAGLGEGIKAVASLGDEGAIG